MPDTIKIPGIGPLEKKYAYIGAAGIAGFVGYSYWRSRQAAAVDTTATDTTATDTTALDAANSAASDWGYASGDGGYAYGGAPVYQSPGNAWYPTPTGNTITSDPEWAQAAVEWLTNVGVDTQAGSHAISTYLANLCLTGAEADFVRQALAGVGQPPQTHHTVTICPTGGTGGNPGTATAPTGLHASGVTGGGMVLTWNAVAGATKYALHVSGGGLNVTHTPSSPHYALGHLKKNTTYSINVKSVVGSATSPASSSISVKTRSK